MSPSVGITAPSFKIGANTISSDRLEVQPLRPELKVRDTLVSDQAASDSDVSAAFLKESISRLTIVGRYLGTDPLLSASSNDTCQM
jgi:hypothetical protein